MLLVTATLLGAAAPIGTARGAPPGGEFTSAITNGVVSIVDPTDDTVVVRGDGGRISRETNLVPTLAFTPKPDGFDITFEFHNDRATPQPLGNLIFDGLMLGQVIDHWDFRGAAMPLRHDRAERDYATGGLPYPDEIYSPVIVLGNNRYTIGISLLYPYLQYRHSVTTHTGSAVIDGAQSVRPWSTGFGLKGELPAGETRRYTVAFRVMNTNQSDQNAWIRTLVPYRDYFQSLYGPMRYQRDARSVLGVHIAFAEKCSAANPRGWVDDERRPDTGGWEPWVSWISRELSRLQYERVMIWAASGCYLNNKNLNFPYQAISPVKNDSRLNTTYSRLQTLPRRGPSEVGYWWGNSQLVMRQWDDPDFEEFDLHNSAHVSRALTELRTATDLGAKCIGLDAYSYIDGFEAFEWLEMMKVEAPGVKFVTELDAPDIIHLLGPTFLYSHMTSRSHVLADLIMPGHEIWMLCTFEVIGEIRGRPLSKAEEQAEIRRVANLGYIPVVVGDRNNPDRSLRASESWRNTIPSDLWPTEGIEPVVTLPNGEDPLPVNPPVVNNPAPQPPTPDQATQNQDPRRTFRRPRPSSSRPESDRLPPAREDRSSPRPNKEDRTPSRPNR